jgi:hypothetical protein
MVFRVHCFVRCRNAALLPWRKERAGMHARLQGGVGPCRITSVERREVHPLVVDLAPRR